MDTITGPGRISQAPTASLHTALILDSHVPSRLGVLENLRRAKVAGTILEAKSVSDGIALLSRECIDACFVGPGVSEPIAARFLREASAASLHRNCLFVAILPQEADHGSLLFAAGADAILPSSSPRANLDRLLWALVRRPVPPRPACSNLLPGTVHTASRRHLIVDAHAGRQKQLRTILRSLGCRVDNLEICREIEEAPSLVAARRYDSLLICLSPWEGDALELIRQQLSLDLPPHIIAYSPQATREQVVSAALAGASGFLAYPFSAGTVEGVLNAQGP
jgi:CheY-like chemotaxis protein